MSEAHEPSSAAPSSADHSSVLKPPGAWAPLWRATKRVKRPVERFLHREAASGLVLMAFTAIALAWANSPWAASYTHLWHTPLGVRVGGWSFERPLEWVVNDAAMAIFFFVVGLEIRREIHAGELSEWRRAALPVVAACGGMLVPAGFALAATAGTGASHGWAVPMATDIAFAVGVLTMLGPRVPPALRVLLLALAVIDDLGAILVIAFFYSSGVQASGFALALAALCTILALQAFGVRRRLAYAVPALLVWVGACLAGVHPTIAGVAVGLCTPVRPWAPRETTSPAEDLIDALHPWVAFGIMPIFALANAGVALGGVHFDADSRRAALGTLLGLVLGKPIGIVVACVLSLRIGLVRLPRGLGLRHLVVLGTVAGIGFTMSLFIAQLAYPEPHLLAASKAAVLAASTFAALLAVGCGRWLLPPVASDAAARESDAEASTDT